MPCLRRHRTVENDDAIAYVIASAQGGPGRSRRGYRLMETALEHILTHAHKPEMIAFLDDHPEYFKEAIALAVSDKQPYSWRAAWLLSDCMKENDERIMRAIRTIVGAFPGKKDGHQRELLKILLRMKVQEDFEGYLFDICMGVWEDISKVPSVRLTAFRYILKLAGKYPDLVNEVAVLTQKHYLDTLSPGVRRSIARMTKNSAIRLEE